jgi:hypothetical protein
VCTVGTAYASDIEPIDTLGAPFAYEPIDTLDVPSAYEPIDTIEVQGDFVVPPDSMYVYEEYPTAPVVSPYGDDYYSRNWVKQLFMNGFRINEPGVNYPKFARFCLKVYNWGDRIFNSYDKDYVVATGKNWKASLRSFNWLQNYSLFFPNKLNVRMYSDLYVDIAPSINFMAVGLSYAFNANEMLHNSVTQRRNFEWDFTCSLFTFHFSRSSVDGGVSIKKFGKYNYGHRISVDYNDISQTATVIDGYYFFNHRHYSHAAAYCYSKYQLKSSGTLICGFNYERRNVGINFSNLPEGMLAFVPDGRMDYNFNYADYNVIVGYGYNWVLFPRRWLFNITTLPALGYKHTFRDSSDGRKEMFAGNIKMRMSLVYNHKALFAALNGRFDGSLYLGEAYTFVNSNLSLALTVGARF